VVEWRNARVGRDGTGREEGGREQGDKLGAGGE
jgi:hypothetical protein